MAEKDDEKNKEDPIVEIIEVITKSFKKKFFKKQYKIEIVDAWNIIFIVDKKTYESEEFKKWCIDIKSELAMMFQGLDKYSSINVSFDYDNNLYGGKKMTEKDEKITIDKEVAELIEIAEDYIENMEEKNMKGIKINKEKLRKAVEMLYDADISSSPKTEGSLKKELKNLYSHYIDLFASFISNQPYEKSIDYEKEFKASEYYKNFKKDAFEVLTKNFIFNKINDVEYDKLVAELGIDINEYPMVYKEIEAKVSKPKPTTPPPTGQKWVWDEDAQEWVLMKA